MNTVQFEMTVKVPVRGEDKPRTKTVTYSAPQVESVKDAAESLTAHFQGLIDSIESGKARPASLQLVKQNENGKDESYDATAQQLASDYIVSSVRSQQKLDVANPLRQKIADELYPEKKTEKAIEKFAEDIVERRKAVGKVISMDAALQIARAAYVE